MVRDAACEEGIPTGREQAVSLDEKFVQGAGRCGSRRTSYLIAKGRGHAMSYTLAFVIHRASSAPRAHSGIEVWQVEKRPCDPHRQRLIAIERVKPDTRPPVAVAHIRSNIQFEKIRNPRQGWQTRRSHASHEKWHQSNVGPTVPSIDLKPRRKSILHGHGIPVPVEKQQIFPTLPHDDWTRGRAGVGDGGHAVTFAGIRHPATEYPKDARRMRQTGEWSARQDDSVGRPM